MEKIFRLFGFSLKITNTETQKEPEKDDASSMKEASDELLKEGEREDIDIMEENETRPLLMAEYDTELYGKIKMYDFMELRSSSRSSLLSSFDQKYSLSHHESKISDGRASVDLKLRIGPPLAKKRSPTSTLDGVNQIPRKKRKMVVEPSDRPLMLGPTPDPKENMTTVLPNHDEEVLPDQNPWEVRKILKNSDVNSSSRLLIGKETALNHILPHVQQHVPDFDEWQGARLVVWDVDTGTQLKLMFKKWGSSNSYVFNEHWIDDFVKRRKLKKNDEIGLRWDANNSRLEFTVINVANHQE